MPDEFDQLGQAIHASTRRTVESVWPRDESADALLDVAEGALNHVEGTIDGFLKVTEAKVDCRMGCSFCCWLRIDVRAHEVFLILRHLRRERTEEELSVLRSEARMTREALAQLTDSERPAVQRPCLLLREGMCSVYQVRPAACRRYFSTNVTACERNWQGAPVEEEIQPAVVAEAGRFAATAVHRVFVNHGYDGYSYDFPLALAEALEDPDCETRWLDRGKAFSTAAESPVPPGFSQAEALAALRAAGPAEPGAVMSGTVIYQTPAGLD